MLVGDLLTYEVKSEQSGGSPHCRSCCSMQSESILHILTICSAYSDVRMRILEEFSYLCLQSQSKIRITDINSDSEKLCQFILDPTSINLKERVSPNDPLISDLFQLSRDICYSINEKRIKLLKNKEQETMTTE